MPIIKMLSRRNLSSIDHSIHYVLREGKNETFNGQMVEPILHNLRSHKDDINGIVQEITQNESYRKITANRVYCYHTILSFSNLDKPNITIDKLKAITNKYLELRGNVCAYAIPHFNTESVHIHVIEGSTFYRESRSTTLSKADLQALKNQLETYVQDQFPELTHSRVRHGQNREYLTEQEYHLVKNGRSKKQELLALVMRCLKHAKSRTQFIQALNRIGILHYERNQDGVITGVIDPETGRKHRMKTLGISPEQILDLNNPIELSREVKLKQKLMDLRNQHDLEPDR